MAANVERLLSRKLNDRNGSFTDRTTSNPAVEIDTNDQSQFPAQKTP
jgi:hypothetical protein